MCRKSFIKIHNGITEHFSCVHLHHNGAALTGFLRTTKDSGKENKIFHAQSFGINQVLVSYQHNR